MYFYVLLWAMASIAMLTRGYTGIVVYPNHWLCNFKSLIKVVVCYSNLQNIRQVNHHSIILSATRRRARLNWSQKIKKVSLKWRKTLTFCWLKKYGFKENMLVGGLEHLDYFSIYWECHHPNWRSHIFQRGRYTTNQYGLLTLVKHLFP